MRYKNCVFVPPLQIFKELTDFYETPYGRNAVCAIISA
jgi:hypothetical protein